MSFICTNFKQKRKEFVFVYLEDLKFIVLDAEKKREVQLRIGYAQMDNNIANKPLFPVIMFPKELVKKRDKALEKRKKQPTENESLEVKEFFNVHFTTRLEETQVLFIEEIEFLVQTIVLQMDDEFIGYIFRFSSEITDLLHTNLTGVHSIFVEKSLASPIEGLEDPMLINAL